MSNEPGSNTSGVAQSNVKQTSVDVSKLSEQVVDSGQKMSNAAQQANASFASETIQVQGLIKAFFELQEKQTAIAKGVEFVNSLKRQVQELTASKQEMRQFEAAQLGVKTQAGPLIDQLNAAEKSMNKFSFSSEGARKQMLGIALDIGKGDWEKVTESVTEMALSAGALDAAFTPQGAAITAVVVALTALAYISYKNVSAISELKNSLQDTNNFSGQSVESLFNLADSLGEVTNRTFSSQEAILALTATGKFGADSMMVMGEAAVNMSMHTGKSVGEMVAQLTEMSNDVIKFADQYQASHHTMSASDRERIDNLVSEGKSIEAAMEMAKLMSEQSSRLRKKELDEAGLFTMVTEGLKEGFNDVSLVAGKWVRTLSEGESTTQLMARANNMEASTLSALSKAIIDNDAVATEGYQRKLAQVKEWQAELGKKAKVEQAAIDREKLAGQTGDFATLVAAHNDDTSFLPKSELKIRALNKEKETMAAIQKGYDDIKKKEASVNPKDMVVVENSLSAAKKVSEKKIAGIEEHFSDKTSKAPIKSASVEVAEEVDKLGAQIAAAQRLLKRTELDIETAFDKGEIGKLEVMRKNADAKQKYFEKERTYRNDDIKAAPKGEVAAKQKALKNFEDDVTEKNYESAKKADAEYFKFVQEIEQRSIETSIKQYEAKGEYVNAAMLRNAQLEKTTITGINLNIQVAQEQLLDATANAFSDGGASMNMWSEILKTTRKDLESTLSTKSEVISTAQGKEDLEKMQKIFTQMKQEIDEVNAKASEGGGVLAKFATAEQIVKIKNSASPELEKMMDKAKGDLAMKDLPKEMGESLKKSIDEIQAYMDQRNQLIKKDGSGFFTDQDLKNIQYSSELFAEMSSAASGMGDSFKGAATALKGLSEGMNKLAEIQVRTSTDDKKNQRDRIGAYGDMANAAKSFFNEGSAGYRTLDGVAQVFHAAQMAMNLVEMGQLAIKAVLTQAQGEPYTAWARMAAMVAVVGGLGFAVGGGFSSGGGGGKSAAEMQKEQGTGGVFGDALAKSSSISKSIDILKSNSNLMLPVNQGMLAALKNIEASMAGLTNLVVRTPGITDGTNLGIQTGTISKSTGASIAAGAATGAAAGSWFGPVGAALGALGGAFIGALTSLWGKTTQNIVDSGLQYGGKVSDLQAGKGYSQYASIDTTTSSWFGLKKSTTNSVQVQGLNAELSQQFGLIFVNLESALKLAAKGLGSTADNVGKILDDMTITTTKVSLKGLTGAALTEALNAVISKTMDEMAEKALPGLDKFRQVGEGYAQTVIRVASGVEVADSELSKFGITAIKFSDVINKQGDVAAEIVRQSITGVEVMRTHYDAANTGATVYATTLTGVGKIMETMSGTASELTTVYQQLLDVRKLLRAGNIDDKSLNLGMIQGAGGVTQLSDGVSNYADKYFTDAEKNAFAVKELNADFAKLGITVIPQTRKEFRDLVEGIDRSTESGSRLFGSLMTISEAFDKVASANTNDQTAVLKQRHTMEIQIMELSGNAAGATAIKRADELAAMDASLRPLQERIYALNDEQTALATAKQHRELDIQLMEALGNSEAALTARRAIALAGMDEYSQGVQKQIYAITDAKTKAAEAAATDKQHRQLDIDLMEAMGNTEAATAARRAMALEGLDDYSQGVQRQIYAAQDAKAAIQKAKEAADAEAQKAEQEKQAAQQAYDQRLSAAKTALQNAYNAESSALQNVINKMQSFATAARAMQNTLISAATSPVSVADQYASAKADLPNVVSKLREGDQDSISKLQEFVNLSQQSATDFDDYRRDFALAQITLDESALAAERQIKQSQTQLDLLKSQVDGLLQVDKSVLSVADAIRELQNVTAAGLNSVTNAVSGQVAAKAAEDAAKKAANTASSQYGFANGLSYGRDAVSSAYTPPSQGDAQTEYAKYIEFATRWAKENFDTSTGFAQSVTTDVANMLMQSHDSGNFSDDQVLTGGKAYADTVYTRQYGTTTGQGLSQQDNSEMLEELRLMRAEMRAVVSNTKDTSKTLDRWTNVGLPTTETA